VRPRKEQKHLHWLALQGIMVVVVSALWYWQSPQAGLSALMGGVASVIPSAVFAFLFFARQNKRSAQKVVGAFYGGELLKLLLSVALIIIILRGMQVEFLPFLTGFVGAHMGIWLAPLLASKARVTH